MWHWLEENHPVLYEVIQWGILALALAALIHEMLQQKKLLINAAKAIARVIQARNSE